MSGSTASYEPNLTPDEVYHGFIHPWDEQTSFVEPIKAFSPGEMPLPKEDDDGEAQ